MRKTSFNCIYCSSEDIDYPFNNLFDSNSKSWTSRSNPKYPIKAVVDLKGTFVFDGIHIVSHESMIPTRIDLYISNNPNLNGIEINVDNFFEYKSKFNWENIGFFCFSSNERSNWVAREFKKVMLPQVQASFMMFVISECYKSIPGNPYKRVSIVSLIFLGTHLYRPRFGSSLVEMYEDLTNAKKEAIQNENFAQADIINIQIENTKRNRDILNELFQKKQMALKNEEFLVVDSIITNIFSILNQPIQLQQQMQPEQQLVHNHTGQNENAIKSPKASKVFDENNSQDKKKSEGDSRNIKKDDKKKEEEEEEDQKDTDEDKETEEDEQDEDKEDGKDKEEEDKEEEDKEEENGDEKKNEEKDNDIEEEDDDDDNDDDKKDSRKDQLKVKKKSSSLSSPKSSIQSIDNEEEGQPVSDEAKGKEIDPLTDEEIQESEYLIELFGQETVAMIYTENWEVKYQGLVELCDKIKQLSNKKSQNTAFQSLSPIINRMFASNLKSIYIKAVDQTISLIDELNENGTFSEDGGFPRNIVHQLLNASFSKLNNASERENKASIKFIKWASKNDKFLMNDIIQFILKPSQKRTTALLYQNKLDLLGYIIKENENIIDVKDFMPFVLKCLESPNSDVRSSAIKLYAACFNIYGKKIQKYIKNLPKTIKKELLIASGVKT